MYTYIFSSIKNYMIVSEIQRGTLHTKYTLPIPSCAYLVICYAAIGCTSNIIFLQKPLGTYYQYLLFTEDTLHSITTWFTRGILIILIMEV